MKFFITTLFTVLLLNGPARAEENGGGYQFNWFTTTSTDLLNRSSVALAGQHMQRGLQLARRALDKPLDPEDELIAHHNLCIAYLALEKTEAAATHCARAFDLSKSGLVVVKVRGALLLQERHEKNDTLTVLSPLQIVVGNIQRENPGAKLSLFMQ